MGNSESVAEAIRSRMEQDERSYAWLARQTGQPYKRLLTEIRNGGRLSLDVALDSTDALGLSLAEIARRSVVAP